MVASVGQISNPGMDGDITGCGWSVGREVGEIVLLTVTVLKIVVHTHPAQWMALHNKMWFIDCFQSVPLIVVYIRDKQ